MNTGKCGDWQAFFLQNYGLCLLDTFNASESLQVLLDDTLHIGIIYAVYHEPSRDFFGNYSFRAFKVEKGTRPFENRCPCFQIAVLCPFAELCVDLLKLHFHLGLIECSVCIRELVLDDELCVLQQCYSFLPV